jgi:hypothetical protein
MSAQLTFEAGPARIGAQTIPIRRGWFGEAWRRIRLILGELNYAARRLVEVQAPGTVDPQWQGR